MELLAVSEAAERLGVHASRVRQLLVAGELAGRKVGHSWLIPAEGVQQRLRNAPRSGRPLSPARAWGMLELLDGRSASWLSPVARSQVRRLLAGLAEADYPNWAAALRARSERHSLQAHPAAVRRLLAAPGVLLGGPELAARSGMDLVVVNAIPEIYVPAERWFDLAQQLSISVSDLSEQPDVLLRIPRQVWPFADGQDVGLAALAADMLESQEPRARSGGLATLSQLARRASIGRSQAQPRPAPR